MTTSSRGSFLLRSLSLLAAAGWVTACGSDRIFTPSSIGRPAPATSSQNGADVPEPTFLTADPAGPTIANPVIAFWAKKGVDKRVSMYYHARPGHNDSTAFMQFRVRDKSLLQRPDGSNIANGDSVLITVTLIDPTQLKLDFQPAGLVFSAHDPAELKLSFGETLRDLNGDGVVDAKDAAIQRTFRIWRQESLLDPWLPLASLVLQEANEVQANIGGFTGYACAY